MHDYSKDRRRRERDERRRQLLENPNPSCAICGEYRVRCLELHHVAGAANSAATTWLCKNCHALISEMQYDDPPELLRHNLYRDPLTRCASLLSGLHHLQTQVSPNLLELSAMLLALSNHLRRTLGDDWAQKVSEGGKDK
jgi:hypothetical protein